MHKLKSCKGLGILEILIILIAVLWIVGVASSIVNAQSRDTYIKAEYVEYCEEICTKYNIQPELVEAIIETESSGNREAYNGKYGCKGLMQIYEGMHRDRMSRLRVTNLYDAKSNILVGVDLLAELYETYGDDTMKILMIYNGQSHAKQRALDGNFSEYSIKVEKRARELERIHGK